MLKAVFNQNTDKSMAQFNFKCPQCGEMIEADDSLCGSVVECPFCEKGIVVPRSSKSVGRTGGLDRSVGRPGGLKRVRPVSEAVEDDAPRMTQYQQMVQAELENRRKAKRYEAVTAVVKGLVAVVVVLALVGVGLSVWNKKEAKAREQMAAQQAEVERQNAEEEKERKSAVTQFHAYLAREEARLKKVIEEAKITRESIELDQKELSDELERIEKEDARLAEDFKKRGQKRYHEAERILLILKSDVLGRLYADYCGEDLTAIRDKYEGEVKTVLNQYRRAREQLRKNKEKYYGAVREINADVEKKTERAASMISSADKEAEMAYRDQKGRLARLKSEKGALQKGLKGPRERQRIREIEDEIARLEEVIATTRSLVSANKAQAAHLTATEAETSARRKFDTALEERQSDDNDVHADTQHEGSIFQIAKRYERATLDRLHTEFSRRIQFLNAKVSDARQKLGFVTGTVANVDFMKADEIEGVRKKVMAKLMEGVAGQDENGK